MTEAPRVEVVAAALRRDLDDLELYAAFLESTLAHALPEDLVEIERKQSLGDRLKGKAGKVAQIAVTLEELRFVLQPGRHRAKAEIVHVIRGLELDHDEVPLDVWITRLATSLSDYAATHARAASALARITDPLGTL